jgi:hypothetical protein
MISSPSSRVFTMLVVVPFAVACGSVQTAGDADAGLGTGDGGQDIEASTSADAGAGTDAGATVCGTRGAPKCADGTFCFVEGSCGEADQGGACIAPPSSCPKILAPVCGCDGNTYENRCVAQRARMSIRSAGECARPDAGPPERDGSLPPKVDAGVGEPGAACGGIGGFPCSPGLYCKEPLGQCRTIADGMGTCTRRPQGCGAIYAPVCGCDGMTYPNDCVAASAGRSVASTGACP